MKKIIVAAGGTGGHIIPALAVAKKFEEKGWKVLYIGNKNSLEENLAQKAGIEFSGINVQKLYRKFTFQHIKFPIKLISSIQKSKKIIKNFAPNAVLGTGGFVSGPVGYAAYKCKIPLFLHEQNSYPGLTTRLLSKHSKHLFLGFKNENNFDSNVPTTYTGNPINPDKSIATINFEDYGFRKNSLKLFLLGGSQGSLALNKAIYPILDKIYANEIDLIWQIGKYSYAEFSAKIKNRSGVYGFDFSDKINSIYQQSDFAIARGGALSLAELEVNKIPSIIVPLPTAAGNHQFHNAKEWVNNKIGTLIEQNSLTPETLCDAILDMKQNLSAYKSNFTDSVHQNAAEMIANYIIKNH
jgi:UDP-N-acetylglucosamine--N-acetylmuramyl-(pentapeptide) pyrophosphoryl-undecaprenol N-acetylglucosamine transferase